MRAIAVLGFSMMALFSAGVHAQSGAYVLDYSMNRIDSRVQDLAQYKGRVAARFEPRTRSDAPEVIAKIEGLLGGSKAPASSTKGLWF